jgi:MFS family permease
MTYSLGCIIAIMALGALSLSSDPSQSWMLYLYVILFGPGVGLVGPTGTAALADLFQGNNFGTINGFVVAGFGLGGSIGPWLGGFIYDVTGSYNLAFLISAFSIAVAALLVWIAAPRKVRLVSGKAAYSGGSR